MDVQRFIAELDTEISRLQAFRASVVALGSAPSTASAPATKGRRGRPKGSKNAAKSAAPASAAPAKTAKKSTRKLSPEGRKRIADAMKKRWADRRKEAGK